ILLVRFAGTSRTVVDVAAYVADSWRQGQLAILSIFDFDIEYIKGETNSLPDFLTREFLKKIKPKLQDKGKGKIGESSKTQIFSKPIKSWYEICHEEENEKSPSSSKSSKNTIVQDAQDPNEFGSQIKKWIESFSQSPEVALTFSLMKEETPFKQIAASNQTIVKFLQAKSTASAMLAQAKTKKEYKKLMAEMLSSMDSESEDEKYSASSIKTVDLGFV
ncbi:hypothetical protein Gotur_027567, partial [Gossypium turneri]